MCNVYVTEISDEIIRWWGTIFEGCHNEIPLTIKLPLSTNSLVTLTMTNKKIGNSVEPETVEKLESLNLDDGKQIHDIEGIEFVNYEDESRLESVMRLVGRDLSEPYSGKFPPSSELSCSRII